MKVREGDVIEDVNRIIFDVKGLVHPPAKIIAFPRFIPDLQGNCIRGRVAYKKIYGISERFEFLKQNFPHYIVHDPVFNEELCEVPKEEVKKHYQPINYLRQLRHGKRLDELERDAFDFLQLLKDETGISWSKMGISGSLLVKLHTANSDIDPIIYGSENCRKVYEALKFLMQDAKGNVKAYTQEGLRKLYAFRVKDTIMSFEDFMRTESRKVLQGKFKTRDYFVRFVKDWNEIREEYGSFQYRNMGYARIRAEVEDDSEAILTPCTYELKNDKVLSGTRISQIEEIASFRGRFCEQARNGETIIAQGKVEQVTDRKHNCKSFRLLLGNKPSDYMVLASS